MVGVRLCAPPAKYIAEEEDRDAPVKACISRSAWMLSLNRLPSQDILGNLWESCMTDKFFQEHQ